MKKYISPTLLLLAAMIWGFAFTAQKAAESVPPFTLGVARSIIAALFLLILVPFSSKLRYTGTDVCENREHIFTKSEIIGGAGCGVILALASFFQQAGMAAGADAGKSSFITALYVVLVPIYALVLKKRAPINVWCGVAISVVGFYFLCIDGDFSIAPEDLTVFVCALIFPLHILLIDVFSPRCDGIRMSFVQFFVCTLVNTVLALIFESPLDFVSIGNNILPILFLGIMSSGVAYTLQIIGQAGVNPAAASIILSLESVFGVIGGLIFLGESMSAREYIGCAAVFLAVVLSQLDLGTLKQRKSK